MFSNIFQESSRLWDNVEKCCGARRRRWQNGSALHSGLVMLDARMHMPAPVRPHPHARTNLHANEHARARAHTHTRTHTHTHTHTKKNVRHCFCTATMVSWTRLSVTVYVHCLSCWLADKCHWQYVNISAARHLRNLPSCFTALQSTIWDTLSFTLL